MKEITFYRFRAILSAVASVLLLLSLVTAPNAEAAGINQKGLAVELSFENAVGVQPNFDLRGFTVVNGTLSAFGTVTWSGGAPVGFELPVLSVSGSCDVLTVIIEGLENEATGEGFTAVSFAVHSGEVTPNAVRNLLCAAARIASGGGNGYALAAALNRILPAIQ